MCEEQNPFLSGTDFNVPYRTNDLPSLTIKPATSPKRKPITVKMEGESFKSGLVAAFDDDDDEEWCDFNMRPLERYRMGNPISKNIDMILGLWFMSAQKMEFDWNPNANCNKKDGVLPVKGRGGFGPRRPIEEVRAHSIQFPPDFPRFT